jgi:tetratricopeptide (TPR) repeat protein
MKSPLQTSKPPFLGSTLPPAQRPWTLILGIGALLLITLAAYYPLRLAGFIWDDAQWLTNNSLVHHWSGFQVFWLHPEAMAQYDPMTFSFLSIEYHLWHLHSLPYHLVNVLFQAINAILLWLALRRLEFKSAFLAAALFAIHPVQVETVGWVAEQKNLLSGFFYFLALLTFLQFIGIGPQVEHNQRAAAPARPCSNHQLYVVSTILFLLGLFSNTAVCTLPVAILVILWWKNRLRDREVILHLIPWFIIAFIIGLVTIHVEHTSVGAHGPDWRFSIAQRFMIAGHAFWFYLIKLLWPHPLLMIYPRWHLGDSVGYLWGIAAAVLFLLLWTLKSRIGRGPMAAMLFYLVTIAPVLGFITFYTQLYSFVSDHYQYLACIGPMVLAGELLYWAAGRAKAANAVIPLASATVILILLGGVTFSQSRLYQSNYRLWHYVVLHNRHSFITKGLYGSTLLGRGQFQAGMRQLVAANAMHRHVAPVVFSLAAGYMLTGHYHRALHYYGWYLLKIPSSVDAWTDAANCLIALRAYGPAAKDLAMACKLKPDFAVGWMELAHVSYLAGHQRFAEQFYHRAISLDPTMAKVKLAISPADLPKLPTDHARIGKPLPPAAR